VKISRIAGFSGVVSNFLLSTPAYGKCFHDFIFHYNLIVCDLFWIDTDDYSY